MLRGLRQWHNAAGSVISQAYVGDTVTFDVPGLPRQVWIEQTQNGNPQYTGLLSLPVNYTFYPRDAGTFVARIYDVANGNRGPNLLYSYSFTVLNPTTPAAAPTPSVLAPLPGPVAGSPSGLCAEVQYPDGSTQINGPVSISQSQYQSIINAQPGMKVLRFFSCGGVSSVTPPLTLPAAGPGLLSNLPGPGLPADIAPSITPGQPGSVPTGMVPGQTPGGNVLTTLYRFYLWMGNGYATGANYNGCSKVNSSMCDPQWFAGDKTSALASVYDYAQAHGETPYEVFSADEPFQLINGSVAIDPNRLKSSFPWWLLIAGGLVLVATRRRAS